jgi:hypothetical protein
VGRRAAGVRKQEEESKEAKEEQGQKESKQWEKEGELSSKVAESFVFSLGQNSLNLHKFHSGL